MNENTPSLVFQRGLSLGPGRCRILAQLVEDDGDRPRQSLVLDWEEGADEPRVTPVGWIATRLTFAAGSDACALLGPEGDFAILSASGLRDEPVAVPAPGPEVMGHLRDLRTIAGHFVAAGMGRQVYVRGGGGDWRRLDEGVLADPADLAITGFNAIDGSDLDHLHAAGFGGEIWYRDGDAWRPADSPTNLVLYSLVAVSADEIYAAGQSGVVLRGCRDTWQALVPPDPADDIWDVAWFDGRLFVATRTAVFVREGDAFRPLPIGASGPGAAQALHAGHGALWSFGASHLAWSEDGETWRSVGTES